jgi:hypothetical protein
MSWKKLGMEFGLQPVVAARDERLSLVQRFEYSVENREGLQFVTFDGELADLSRPFYSRTRNLGPGRCEGIRVCFCRAQVSGVLRSWRRGGVWVSDAPDRRRWRAVSCHLAESRRWKSDIIDARVHAGMKSRSCIFWVLGLLLVIASVDTIPDPPALNPRSVGVALLCEARGEVCERLNSGWIISSLVQVRWIAFTSAYETKLPTDWIALTGLATDPSPPTL